MLRTLSHTLVLGLLLGVTGCMSTLQNPSFAVSTRDAKAALREMKKQPKPLTRPVMVLSGFLDPGVASFALDRQLRELTGDDRVIGVSFAFCSDFDDCRRRAIEAVDKAFPCDDADETVEVDVVAVSMGGVVARYSAAEVSPSGGRRLKIARLFTIASPHLGADLANAGKLPVGLAGAMRSGSPFMNSLDEALAVATYKLYPYARTNDWIVGETNTAPRGVTPWWVATPPLDPGHAGAFRDERIVADIARRLRGEEPFTIEPAAPLPQRG